MYRNQSGNASRISTKATILSTSPLFSVRITSRVRATGLDYTMEHPAETPDGNSPLDCCIYMGSSLPLFPVRATGLDYTMEHPAETPGGNSPPDCCIYMGSSPAAFSAPKIGAPLEGAPIFGAGDRTRTCTAKPEEPKSTESTNSTTPACCL